MHSCCRISGIPQGDRSPRGPSEYDKHPAFKLRKANLAHDKRLALHLAHLDQRCQEITSRMAHRMKMTSLALKHIQSNSNAKGKYGTAQKLIPSRDTKVSRGRVVMHADLNSNSGRNDKTQRLSDVHISKRNPHLPAINTTKHDTSCVSLVKQRRKQLHKKSCCYGTTTENEKCLHFPCHQPETYHSLGFRLDDSSTQKWITWADLKKSKIDVPNYNTTSNVRSQYTSEQSSELRRWCSLPMDFESRKQRLKEDIEKRRKLNMANKPQSWETNYGKMTPYKVLAYPVRLHPLQMTTQ